MLRTNIENAKEAQKPNITNIIRSFHAQGAEKTMYLKIIDKLHRCVIPKNDRLALGLKPGDMIEVEFKRIVPEKEKKIGSK